MVTLPKFYEFFKVIFRRAKDFLYVGTLGVWWSNGIDTICQAYVPAQKQIDDDLHVSGKPVYVARRMVVG